MTNIDYESWIMFYGYQRYYIKLDIIYVKYNNVNCLSDGHTVIAKSENELFNMYKQQLRDFKLSEIEIN